MAFIFGNIVVIIPLYDVTTSIPTFLFFAFNRCSHASTITAACYP